jgi:hypothetical protein
MSFRIGRWNCTYQVMGTQPQAMLAVDALDRRLRRSALDAYEATLEEAFGNDPAVYVVRRLDVALAMHVSAEPNDPALARRWGSRMGAEAVRAIAAAGSANVVRFADEAEFIANFLADLLRDLAWQRWCYGAFGRFRHTPRNDAVLTILREHSRQLTAIFRCLARLGCLRAVLDLLDANAAAALWNAAVRPSVREPQSSEFRVFVLAAQQIAASLGLWIGEPVDEGEILKAYAAMLPPPPDWTDHRSLAAAVWSILRFAQRRGYIAIPREGEVEERWTQQAASLVAALDWLDLEWLRQMLANWGREAAGSVAAMLSAGPPGAATPNQLRLLARLRQILAAAVIPFDRARPDSESNALRLFAVLAASDPELAAHAATASIMKLLLAAWNAVASMEDPITAVQQLRSGRIPVAPDLPYEQSDALRSVAALGAPAADVLHELLAHSPIALGTRARDSIETGCAGLFLLLRAITEVRLPQLSPPVLLALGLQWAGPASLRAGAPDPGLALWSGLTGAEPAAAVLTRLDPKLSESLLAKVTTIIESRASIDPGLVLATEIPADWISALTEAWPADVPLPSSLTLLAIHLLRLWARWLRSFSHSSVPHLLRNVIRRPGRIELRTDEIAVSLPPLPLDPILEMSGYLAPTPPAPWLAGRRVLFRIDRSGV